MSVKTKEELLKTLDSVFGDTTSDEAISFLEDLSDTLDSFQTEDTEDWKAKYEENDKSWKQKYHDRFFSHDDVEEEKQETETETETPKTYEDLFSND